MTIPVILKVRETLLPLPVLRRLKFEAAALPQPVLMQTRLLLTLPNGVRFTVEKDIRAEYTHSWRVLRHFTPLDRQRTMVMFKSYTSLRAKEKMSP